MFLMVPQYNLVPKKSKERYLNPWLYPLHLTHHNVLRNFCGMLIVAHFPSKYIKFQIFVDQSIFVVQKHSIYEKSSIFIKK